MTLSAQYPGRSSAPITAYPLESYPYSLLSGVIQDLDLVLKGASPYQHQHSAAIRECIERVKQRLEEAEGKIQNLNGRLQAEKEAKRTATTRAEEAIRGIKERDSRIAALERRLKLSSDDSHQPPCNVWPATPKKPPRRELADFERQEGSI